MAVVSSFFGSAVRAAASGFGANEFVRLVQAEGLGTRRSEVLKVFKQAKALVVASKEEPFRNPYAVPTATEMGQWPVKNPAGIRQNVKIVYRDKVTGDYKTTHYSVLTPNGITREQAMAEAVAAYADAAERYGQMLVGAYHSSAQMQVQGIQ